MAANDRQLKIHTAVASLFIIVACWVAWQSHGKGGPIASIRPVPVMVELKGDVPVPGVYLLEPGHAGIADALRAAGWSGTCPNENRRMASGESLTVAGRGPDWRFTVDRMEARACLAAALKLDLNSASARDLLLIPAIRPDVADAIIKRREKKPWDNVADLVELQGVGQKTAQRLESFLEAIPPGQRKGHPPAGTSFRQTTDGWNPSGTVGGK